MLQLFGGYGFQDLLNQLDQLGFFEYVLPFLLIFAVVYAILTKIEIFKQNKGASVVAALAIGLLALQLNFVPAFFKSVFPKFGIGLAVLLIALILGGAFIMDITGKGKEAHKWIFFGLGMLIFLIVVLTSFSDWRFTGTGWWDQYAALVIAVVVIAGAIVGIILAGRERTSSGKIE